MATPDTPSILFIYIIFDFRKKQIFSYLTQPACGVKISAGMKLLSFMWSEAPLRDKGAFCFLEGGV